MNPAVIIISIWAAIMLVVCNLLDIYEMAHPEEEEVVSRKNPKRNVKLLLELQEMQARAELNQKYISFGEDD